MLKEWGFQKRHQNINQTR